MFVFMSLLCATGRENTETRRDGDVRIRAHYHVLCHVGSSDPQNHTILMLKHIIPRYA